MVGFQHNSDKNAVIGGKNANWRPLLNSNGDFHRLNEEHKYTVVVKRCTYLRENCQKGYFLKRKLSKGGTYLKHNCQKGYLFKRKLSKGGTNVRENYRKGVLI